MSDSGDFITPATRDEIESYEARVRDELHCQAHGYPRRLCLACKTDRFRNDPESRDR